MLLEMQMLVCAQLFNDLFPLGLKEAHERLDDDEDAPDRLLDERGNQDSAQIIRALRQPAVLGMAAGVCKTWREAVKKHRRAKLVDAVEKMNTFPKRMVLYMNACAVPAATSMRFTLSLGKREMYEVTFVRRTIEEAAADVPQELIAQCVIQTHDGKATWTSPERHYAFHKLCFVDYWALQPAEKDQHRLWHKDTSEALNMWLEHQYNIFKLRLL